MIVRLNLSRIVSHVATVTLLDNVTGIHLFVSKKRYIFLTKCAVKLKPRGFSFLNPYGFKLYERLAEIENVVVATLKRRSLSSLILTCLRSTQ